MFAKTIDIGFAQRVVATLVASAMVMASYGFYNTAQAANLTDVSNTLSNSAPSETSAHTIEFTIPSADGTGLTGEDITITFPTGDFADVATVADANTTITGGGGSETVSASGDVVTVANVTAAAGDTITVAIDDGVITNPAKSNPAGVGDSYELEVATPNDSGRTRVVIIDTVLVTADVSTTFEFTVSATTTGASVNGDNPTIDSTATTIPFGNLTAGDAERIAQELTVTTNSKNGFTVTVESDGDLRSSTGAVIDNFVDGSDLAASGTAWTVPGNDVNDDTTWGHWGMTSNDSDLANEMVTGSSYIAASTTPREIFSHDGSADGVTQDIGKALVGYQVEISALQEAGDDYQTTLTYIATPTF